MTHDELLEDAKKAISAVFGDRSVSPRTTIESLENMASDIDSMVDALENDLQRSES